MGDVEGEGDDLVDEPGVVVDGAVGLARGGGDRGGDGGAALGVGLAHARRRRRGGRRRGRRRGGRRGVGGGAHGRDVDDASRAARRARARPAAGRPGGRPPRSEANLVKRARRPFRHHRLPVLDGDDRQVALGDPARSQAEGAVGAGEARTLGQARGGEGAAALGAGLGDEGADRGDGVEGEAGEFVRRLAVGGLVAAAEGAEGRRVGGGEDAALEARARRAPRRRCPSAACRGTAPAGDAVAAQRLGDEAEAAGRAVGEDDGIGAGAVQRRGRGGPADWMPSTERL